MYYSGKRSSPNSSSPKSSSLFPAAVIGRLDNGPIGSTKFGSKRIIRRNRNVHSFSMNFKYFSIFSLFLINFLPFELESGNSDESALNM